MAMSLAASLPRQQEEAQSPPHALAPPPPHATRGTRWQQSAGAAMARKLEPNASKGAAPPLRSLSQVARSSSAAAARGGAGPGGLYRAALASSASAGTMPRVVGSAAAGRRQAAPGSAAASASQVEALLGRLEELETHASEAAKSEEELKAINLALMERLAAFQAANDANVEAAERGSNRHPHPHPRPRPRPRPRPHLCLSLSSARSPHGRPHPPLHLHPHQAAEQELGSLHGSLQEANAARTAAEAAAEEAFLQLSEQRTHTEAVAVGAQGAEEEAAQARRRAEALPLTPHPSPPAHPPVLSSPHRAPHAPHPTLRPPHPTSPHPSTHPTPPPAPPTPPLHSGAHLCRRATARAREAGKRGTAHQRRLPLPLPLPLPLTREARHNAPMPPSRSRAVPCFGAGCFAFASERRARLGC